METGEGGTKREVSFKTDKYMLPKSRTLATLPCVVIVCYITLYVSKKSILHNIKVNLCFGCFGNTLMRFTLYGKPTHGRLTHGRLTHGRLTHGRLTHGRLTHGRLTHDRLTHGRLTHGRLTHGRMTFDIDEVRCVLCSNILVKAVGQYYTYIL